jgi:hypothetical protein
MGLAAGALPFILQEGAGLPWCGAALTLGRQDVGFGTHTLTQAAERHRYGLRTVDDHSEAAPLSDRQLFHRLGFDSLCVMDVNAYEGADVLLDLNARELPAEHLGRFDLVLDGGTLEHVFDVAQALRNLCRLVRVGGRILHISPMSNCADHGFYSFSPTLFQDFYAANAFEIRRIATVRLDERGPAGEWAYTPYRPGELGTLGALPAGAHFLMACVRRLPQSRSDVTPVQAYYRDRAWRAA